MTPGRRKPRTSVRGVVTIRGSFKRKFEEFWQWSLTHGY